MFAQPAYIRARLQHQSMKRLMGLAQPAVHLYIAVRLLIELQCVWCRKPWRLEGRRSSVPSWRVCQRSEILCYVVIAAAAQMQCSLRNFTFMLVLSLIRSRQQHLHVSQSAAQSQQVTKTASITVCVAERYVPTYSHQIYAYHLASCVGRSHAQLLRIPKPVLLPTQCQR